jgi:hypothetical protein
MRDGAVRRSRWPINLRVLPAGLVVVIAIGNAMAPFVPPVRLHDWRRLEGSRQPRARDRATSRPQHRPGRLSLVSLAITRRPTSRPHAAPRAGLSLQAMKRRAGFVQLQRRSLPRRAEAMLDRLTPAGRPPNLTRYFRPNHRSLSDPRVKSGRQIRRARDPSGGWSVARPASDRVLPFGGQERWAVRRRPHR